MKQTTLNGSLFWGKRNGTLLIWAICFYCTITTGCTNNKGASADTADEIAAIASVFNGSKGKWVDLTHSFSEETIYWPTDTSGFKHEELSYGKTEGGWFYSSYRYSGAEHGGTHIDAPIHFAEGKKTCDAIPLSNLIAPAVVIDVADHANADYLVSVNDMEKWEAAHGKIPEGAIVLIRTGWDKLYNNRTACLGTALTGPEAVPALHFPGIDPVTAEWLVKNRKVKAVGIDTPSMDYGQSKDFKSHVIFAENNVPGFENVANLFDLPSKNIYVVALPMKTKGGSGGPLRIVAYVP